MGVISAEGVRRSYHALNLAAACHKWSAPVTTVRGYRCGQNGDIDPRHVENVNKTMADSTSAAATCRRPKAARG
jgi:hypothetical protein